METNYLKTVFRNLVTNRFDPELNYIDCELSFQTVFFKSFYSHCCCPCAFQHEYLEYVSNTGDVDEAIYEKVLQNIINGKCPHVDDVNEKYVRETSIYAIHIAAGVGIEGAVRKLLDNYQIRRGAIFRLSPYRAAVLKSQYNIIDIFTAAIPSIFTDPLACVGSKVMYPSQSGANRNTINVEWITTLEHSIREKDIRLLNCVLSPHVLHVDLNKAFEFIFEGDSLNLEDLLFDYIRRFNYNEKENDLWTECAASAIVYDKPTYLDSLLEICLSKSKEKSLLGYFTINLPRLSDVLKRNECTNVLTKYTLGLDYKYSVEKYLLTLSVGMDDHKAEVFAAIKSFPSTCKVYNILEALNQHNSIDARKVKELIDCATWVPAEDLLMNALSPQFCFHPNFREVFELLLYENPDVSYCPLAVANGIYLDEYFGTTHTVIDFTGSYIMDSKEHTMFGRQEAVHYALNFIGPVLIESGFPFTRATLQAALSRHLDPAEFVYVRNCLNTPRSLQLSCRDTLRRHFKRQQIHDLVKALDIPAVIKDFILLKSTLPSVRIYC